jgi:hypothetical protein
MTMSDSDDDRLLAELRRLAREVDAVPDEVGAYAKAALGWRRVDAELAELLSDSQLDRSTAAAIRSGQAQVRSVTFRATDLEIALEIHHEPALLILGQLVPAVRAYVEIQRDDGATAPGVESDPLGRFRIELERGGRIRLLVRREAPAPLVETSWLDA